MTMLARAGFEACLRSSRNPLARLRAATRNPAESQSRLLIGLLEAAAGTEFGQRYRFRELLRSRDVVAAYQERVPLRDYASIRDAVERMRGGARDVLWPGGVHHFAISSGTASAGHLIPVTREMLRRFVACGFTVSLQYAVVRNDSSFLGGRVLSLPGGVSRDPAHPGVLVGEVSGLMAMAMPRLAARIVQALPMSLMLMDELDRKLELAARMASRQDVRAIVMVPSWSPLLFERVLACFPSSTRPPRLAGDVWPNLRVFFSGGVPLASYRPTLERYLGDRVDYLESYTASEGFFAFQDHPDGDDLAVHLGSGVFFEFVPVGQLGAEHPARHTLETVEPGVPCGLFVTTCSGLWAYQVDDVVSFTSVRPPRLRIVGRTIEMLDRYGEAVRASELREAVLVASRETAAASDLYHLSYAPGSDETPQHELLIEFIEPPRDPAMFVAALDRELRARNRHYRIRREPGVMPEPILTVLPAGTFRRYLERTRSRLSPQSKIAVVSEARDIAICLKELAHGWEFDPS